MEGDSQLRVTTKKNFNVNVPQKGREFSQKKESLTQGDDLSRFEENNGLSHYQLRTYHHNLNQKRGSMMNTGSF